MKSADEKFSGGTATSKKTLVDTEVFERITDAFIALDKCFCFTYVNKKACELLHHESSLLIGKNMWEEFPHDADSPFYHAVCKVMEQQKYVFIEHYFSETDRWFENHIYPSPEGVSIYFRDITDNKKTELALKISEEKYRLLIEQSHDAIFIADHELRILEVNSKASETMGYSTDELLTKTLLELIPEQRRTNAPGLLNILREGKTIFLEGELLTKDGGILPAEISSQMMYDGKIAVFTRDITRRKKVENELREAEEKFRNLVEKSLVGVYIVQDGKFAYVNPKLAEDYGYEQEELMGTDIYSVIAGEEERKKVSNNIRARLAGKHDSLQYEMIGLKKNGGTINVEVYGSRTQYKGRSAIIGTLINITERKQAETELREAEEKFRSLVEKSLVGVYILQDGKFAYVNPKLCEEFGYSQEDLIGADISMTVKDEEGMKKVNEYIRLAGEKDSVHYESTVKRKNKTLIEVEVFGSRTQYNGRPAIIGTLINITERKQSQLRLLQSRRKYKLLFEESPVPMWMFSKNDFSIIDVNKAACKLYGYSREEFLQITLKDIRPVEDIPRLIERVTVRKDNLNHEVWRHKKKDGSIMNVEITSNDIVYEGREVGLAIVNDVTAKLAAEEGLKKSYEEIRQLTEHIQNIREDERTTIAREIHDELGQQLTVLKMDVAWIKKKLVNADNAIQEKLNDLFSVLDTTVKTVRRISSELRPSLLDDLGLVAAVEWHLREFEKRSGIKTQLIKPFNELILNDTVKTALFRIFQESLTNVARHAEAKNVRVDLREKDGHIVLKIEDDGKGFDQQQVRQERTLGILGMKERSEMMGGTYQIKSVKGGGTSVMVNTPSQQL